MFKPNVFIGIVLFVALAGLCGVRAAGAPGMASAEAPSTKGGWHEEFEDVCSKTQDAMSLSAEELAVLVQRCDALLPEIEKLDDTRKKVFMGRLQRCRGLYVYVLDSKKNEKK
jgi:hypothetical protein